MLASKRQCFLSVPLFIPQARLCACLHVFAFCTKAFVAVVYLLVKIYANYPLLIIAGDQKNKYNEHNLHLNFFNDTVTFVNQKKPKSNFPRGDL